MEDKYLDTGKSVIISSPAGSGKTEKLARRYISLLENSGSVEKILCITFTEKAAAEMKERILSILQKEMPALLDDIRPKIPLMRISTIHAFCLKVLKRFSIELGLDPSLGIMDEGRARELWNEALYDTLLSERNEHGVMFDIMQSRGIKGWGQLKRHLDMLAKKAPLPELLLMSEHPEGCLEGNVDEGMRLLTVYAGVLSRYKKLKAEHRLLDFNDLELLAAQALSTIPNATDILYSFDEHTDHILVDEFQDTSRLQWTILDKLTEEWRSGHGPKREGGVTPSIFLVGDEKQSIYLFRGANVAMFAEAKDRFDTWLGNEYHFVEATENYRCLPEIVDFANQLFSSIMNPGPDNTGAKYTAFEAKRKGKGYVGLLTTPSLDSMRERRMAEARAIARLISSHVGSYEIHDTDDRLRPCRYEDLAILLKKRTHLGAYEDALRALDIPFIVVKGIGFFDEPEVALLSELVSFITDPSGDYPLFTLLRSPMFGLGVESIRRLQRSDCPLMEALVSSATPEHKEAAETLTNIMDKSPYTPIGELIEESFTLTGMWSHLGNRQRLANVRKFISIVEAHEETGHSPMEIREKLIRERGSDKAPKANVSSEGMDAVRIMTIHAAKGLQFPMVFIPGMEDRLGTNSEPVVFDDSGPVPLMGFEEDNDSRKRNLIFAHEAYKELEEEKRLFYVAVTRARDYLLMSGAPAIKKGQVNPTGRLVYLEEAFGVYSAPTRSIPLTLLTEQDLPPAPDKAGKKPALSSKGYDLPVHTGPLSHKPLLPWVDMTRDGDRKPRKGHGRGRTLIGNVIHLLLEEISKGRLVPENTLDLASSLIRSSGGDEDMLQEITVQMEKLVSSGIMADIVAPRQGAYTELPVHMEHDGRVYSGRIDRVILTPEEALVYDYKTLVVTEAEIPDVIEDYRRQMELYREAASGLFKRPARAFLVLTGRQEIVEVR